MQPIRKRRNQKTPVKVDFRNLSPSFGISMPHCCYMWIRSLRLTCRPSCSTYQQGLPRSKDNTCTCLIICLKDLRSVLHLCIVTWWFALTPGNTFLASASLTSAPCYEWVYILIMHISLLMEQMLWIFPKLPLCSQIWFRVLARQEPSYSRRRL